MSTRHTQGPWHAVSASALAEMPDMMEIAEVSHMRVVPSSGGWPVGGTPEDDARLIAAAPELLDAARAFVAWAEGSGVTAAPDSPIGRARAAIAKATGGAK